MQPDETATEATNRSPGWLGWSLAGTILVSAFLLFQVQPLICKAILPWFGGSPAVWSTCLLFFQTVLFGGYAYAHLSERYLGPRAQGALHLGLISAALAALPILPGIDWKPHGGSDPTWRILGLLAASVGLPYFVLSSTGPLVQAWFGRAYPGTSPYRLYALSNVGSLAALISYPFVFEPALGVDSQARLWSCAFVVFAVSCGLGAARISRLRRPEGLSSTRDKSAGDGEAARGPAPRTAGRILWLALPACASLMLLATTNHACQDVAAIPFLWIIPLGLYLLSFIICFDHGRWYRRGAFAGAALASILAVAGISGIADLFDAYRHPFTFIHELTLYFSALFFICMVCHGELMRLRPSPRHLTEYYLNDRSRGRARGDLREPDRALALLDLPGVGHRPGPLRDARRFGPARGRDRTAGAPLVAAYGRCRGRRGRPGVHPAVERRRGPAGGRHAEFLRGRLGVGSRPPRPGAPSVHDDAWPDPPRSAIRQPGQTSDCDDLLQRRKRRRAGLDLPPRSRAPARGCRGARRGHARHVRASGRFSPVLTRTTPRSSAWPMPTSRT